MLERHGEAVLLLVGLAMAVVAVTTATAATEVGLAALGTSMCVLAVLLPRIEGPFTFGPGGLHGQLRRLSEREKETRKTLAKVGVPDILAIASRDDSARSDADRATIRSAVDPLLEAVDSLTETASHADAHDVRASALLEAARGLMAVGDWEEAAGYLDRYLEANPDDWDAQFSRAVAYANIRGGAARDVAALRAYNDAITLRPADVDQNLLARLFSYRAAMFKRLERLSEAEADLNLAWELATNPYEREDITYNRACIAAMRRRRDETMGLTKSLAGTQYIDAIRAHLSDYFANFAHDPEFLMLLDGESDGDRAPTRR